MASEGKDEAGQLEREIHSLSAALKRLCDSADGFINSDVSVLEVEVDIKHARGLLAAISAGSPHGA